MRSLRLLTVLVVAADLCARVAVSAKVPAAAVELQLPVAGANVSWPPARGQHRALITVSRHAQGHANGTAVWATVPWQRRATPNASATDAVLTVAATGAVVANVVRAPAGPGIPESEAAIFVFEPATLAPPPPMPPPGPGADGWVANGGTAAQSIVTACSGAQASVYACWKAVDGKLLFNDAGGAPEGWDGKPGEDGVEFLELDLGRSVAVDRFAVYAVGKHEDAEWFPQHNPAAVRLLTRAERTGDDDGGAATAATWRLLFNGTVAASNYSVLQGWGVEHARHFRFEIDSRQPHVAPGPKARQSVPSSPHFVPPF